MSFFIYDEPYTEQVVTRVCKECNQTKPLTDTFFRNEHHHSKTPFYRAECRVCDRNIKRKLALIKKSAPPKPMQCECCKKQTNLLLIDHDHITHKFRGWICAGCNLGIARLGDDLEGIQNAVVYLSKVK
jgi:Recombination endonuclease VII